MWKNSLKNVESDDNKIFYDTLLDLFLQRNGTYFLNKPRNRKMKRSWFGSSSVALCSLKVSRKLIDLIKSSSYGTVISHTQVSFFFFYLQDRGIKYG
jgi:hypothetical protein